MSAEQVITRMVALRLHLLPVHRGSSRALNRRWLDAPPLSVHDAVSHVHDGGTLAVNLALSRMIVIAAHDRAVADTVSSALGSFPTVVPSDLAAAGGAHFYLSVPAGITPGGLVSSLSVNLPNGKVDVLAGNRYVLTPPSWIDTYPDARFTPADGGILG